MHERWLHCCPKGLMYHCSSVPCFWSSIAPPFHYFVFCSILLSVEASDDSEIKRALIGVYQVRVYHTVGNFWGRKLSRIGEKYNFRRENFVDFSLLPHQKMPHAQLLLRTLSRIATKPWNLWKFSSLKVSRYTVFKNPQHVMWWLTCNTKRCSPI